MKNTYKPLHDNVLVKLVKKEEKTSSGIILPGNEKERPSVGEIIAVGPGKIVEGKIQPVSVKIGDKVVFKSYAPSELPNEEDLVIIAEGDIIAIVN